VFGARAAEDIRATTHPRQSRGTPPAPARSAAPPVPRALREVMTRYAGLERDAAGLSEALARITQIERAGGHEPSLLNMTTTAKMVVAGALVRCESRGGHTRSDFPNTASTGTRTFMTLADAERIAAVDAAVPASPARAAH